VTKKWAQGDIQANGIQIHYYRTGGDKPQVVLNHGALDDGLCWTRVAKALEADYDLIMLDARGHGSSDSGQGDYTSQSRAADLAGAIQALELDRPVVGGHSLGADAALYMAAQYPELTRGVFLEDPPIIMAGQAIFGGNLAQVKDPLKFMQIFMRIIRILPGFIGLPLARKMNSGYPDEEIVPWLKSKRRCSRDYLANISASLDLSKGIPTALLSRIEVPILLIIGDRESGAIVSLEVAEQIKAAAADVHIVHLAGASHDIRRVRFDGYQAALRSFLDKIHFSG
jgi:pimeloyl-ACP methyl ester carboxylesterase